MEPHIPLRIPLKVRKRLDTLAKRTTGPMPVSEFRRLVVEGRLVNAPLDGYSDPAWRTICLRHGATLCYTEMIPAIALVFGASDAMRRLRRADGESILAVQIEGAKPDIMVEAARIAVNAGADIIDINAGCPSQRVTNSGAGSALLSDLELLHEIARAVKGAVDVPVSMKVRSGPTQSNIVVDEISAMVNDLDLAAVTIHPRTRNQAYRGKADWSLIARMKSSCRIPVIGNGDIRSPADALRMMETTGCDAVMIARGAIGNPWLFSQTRACLAGQEAPAPVNRQEWERTVWDHFNLFLDYLDGFEGIAARLFRKHLARYTRGMTGATEFRRGLPHINDRAGLRMALERLLAAGEEAGGFVFPMPRPDDTF